MRQETQKRLEKIIDTLEGRQQLIDALIILIQDEVKITIQNERYGRIIKFKPHLNNDHGQDKNHF